MNLLQRHEKKTEKNDPAVDVPLILWYDTHRDKNTCSQKGYLSWIEHTNSGSIRTGSSVRKLDEDGRIHELARMVGGAGDPESGLQHAANMLAAAREIAGGL